MNGRARVWAGSPLLALSLVAAGCGGDAEQSEAQATQSACVAGKTVEVRQGWASDAVAGGNAHDKQSGSPFDIGQTDITGSSQMSGDGAVSALVRHAIGKAAGKAGSPVGRSWRRPGPPLLPAEVVRKPSARNPCREQEPCAAVAGLLLSRTHEWVCPARVRNRGSRCPRCGRDPVAPPERSPHSSAKSQ